MVIPMKTRKIPLSTSVDQDIFDRIEALALVDSRSKADIVDMCAKAGLPLVESEIRDNIKIATEYSQEGKLMMRYGHLEPFCPADMVQPTAPALAYPPHRDETALVGDQPATPPGKSRPKQPKGGSGGRFLVS